MRTISPQRVDRGNTVTAGGSGRIQTTEELLAYVQHPPCLCLFVRVLDLLCCCMLTMAMYIDIHCHYLWLNKGIRWLRSKIKVLNWDYVGAAEDAGTGGEASSAREAGAHVDGNDIKQHRHGANSCKTPVTDGECLSLQIRALISVRTD